MSLESRLKESIMKHAEDVKPDARTWPVIEKRIARGRRIAVIVSTVSVAVLIAAAALITPHLVDRKPEGFA